MRSSLGGPTEHRLDNAQMTISCISCLQLTSAKPLSDATYSKWATKLTSYTTRRLTHGSVRFRPDFHP